MAWVRLPAGFSGEPLVRKVEQRFGLVGFARLCKLLELLAGSAQREALAIELSLTEWLDALQASRPDFDALLAYLAAAEWLTVEPLGQAPAALRVRVTLIQAAGLLPAADDPQLYTDPEQWQAWCVRELAMTARDAADPYAQQLYRRWCASNVTLSEMTQAVEFALAKGLRLLPSALHPELQAIRKRRIEKAKEA